MCGSEVSEGVEVMEGDRRKTEESAGGVGWWGWRGKRRGEML